MKSLLVFTSLLSIASSLKQQIILYEKASPEAQGNVFIFQNNTPSAPLSLAGIERVCTSGYFIYCTAENYLSQRWWSGGVDTCVSIRLAGVKSLRYLGAWETTEDALSLYEGTSYTGDEIFVSRSPYAGITTKIGSLAVTGSSAWTLFEGTNFDGKSTCISAHVNSPYIGGYNNLEVKLNMTTIGSVFKGCASTFSPVDLAAVRKEWRANKLS